MVAGYRKECQKETPKMQHVRHEAKVGHTELSK